MAFFWSKTLWFAFSGETPLPGPQRMSLGPADDEPAPSGPPERLGSGVTSVAGTLRLVVSEAQSLYDGTIRTTRSLYQAVIQPPDDGTLIAPIDLPCIVPVQLPVRVTVYPIRSAVERAETGREQIIMSAWVEPAAHSVAYGGTLWQEIPADSAILVPNWAGAVTILDAVSVTNPPAATVCSWLDFLGAVVGTCIGTYQPRPRRATALRNDNEQSAVNVLFHWTGLP